MPTIGAQLLPSSKLRRWPIGSRPPNQRRANDWFTATAGAPGGASRSSSARPAISGTPIARKKSELVTLISARVSLPGCGATPSMRKFAVDGLLSRSRARAPGQGREAPEQHTGAQRDAEREEQHAAIEPDLRSAGGEARGESHQRIQAPCGHGYSRQPSQDREQEPLDEQLLEEPRAGGAE